MQTKFEISILSISIQNTFNNLNGVIRTLLNSLVNESGMNNNAKHI